MHYIRYLKTPRIYFGQNNVQVKAVITVTTDLGETFYPDNIELVASVRNPGESGDVYVQCTVQWRAGVRSIPAVLKFSEQDIEWPVCMHVSARNSSAVTSGFLSPIVDVWSGSLSLVNDHEDSGRRVERRFTSLSERTVSLLEDCGDSIARHLWDGSQALAQYIDHTISLQTLSPMTSLEDVLLSATFKKLNVLELGCGCGTVGISLAQSVPDCDVLLTDLPEVAELVEANIDRMKPAVASKVAFEPLDWEQELPSTISNRRNNLIIVSECTYNSDTLQPLVGTLSSLVASSPKAVIIVSTKTRHDSEAAFFDMMKNAGLIENAMTRVPLPGKPGTGFSDTAQDVGLHVYRGPAQAHRLTISRSESEDVP